MTRPVIIIGAGPAGLTAARVLRQAGLTEVLVLERNQEAGGLPRFCAHPGWGMLDFRRVWTGPTYARRLVRAAGVEIATGTTALALEGGGRVRVRSPGGVGTVEARAVLLASGIRETPRAARLVSGTRPWGVTTTGAFQEMVTRGGMVPFRAPVIVGSELVAFSALFAARHAGIRPVAMIEASDRITARRPADLLARLLLRVPVFLRTTLAEIHGGERVAGVTVEARGVRRMVECDGVIFTGQFVPEAALARQSSVAIDAATGGPVIDNFWRTSDPAVFAAGNVLRPVEHSGWGAAEGRMAALAILRALEGRLPDPSGVATVSAGGALRYVYPQRVVPDGAPMLLYARAARAHRGRLLVRCGGHVLAERAISALPERRIHVTIDTRRVRLNAAIEVVLD